MDNQQAKQFLSNKLKKLNYRLEEVKIDVRKPHSSDSSEMAQERENDEVIDAIGRKTREEISQVRRALARIEDGTYGLCQQCGQTILDDRLDALPEATLCLSCVQLA